MKTKTNKSLKKRFSPSHPKKGRIAKLMHESPGFSKKITKKRKFRVFRGKMTKELKNAEQVKKILKTLS